MEIDGYIIPSSMQKNSFIQSLFTQFSKKGKLSKNQLNALKGMLDINEDFFQPNVECPESMIDCIDLFNEIKEKLKKNRFNKVSSRNKHIRTLLSILNDEELKDEIETLND
jgi:hypothetical protein